MADEEKQEQGNESDEQGGGTQGGDVQVNVDQSGSEPDPSESDGDED